MADTPRIPNAVHITGIGGVMMSAIAELLLRRGIGVSGSDAKDCPALDRLRSLGATVTAGHAACNLPPGCGLLLASSAVPEDNAELEEARRRGLPVWGKGRMLRELMAGRIPVCIAGTHGKTTTTAMAALVLRDWGKDPTVLVGGVADFLPGNCAAGAGPYLVTETDESDGSFLGLAPDVAIVTNVEADHLDHYGGFVRLLDAFEAFLRLVPPSGLAVVCADDPYLPRLAERAGVPVRTYGLRSEAQFRATDLRLLPNGSEFSVLGESGLLGTLTLRVPGRHNVANALGVATAALHYGVPWEVIRSALGRFEGVKRRLEHKGRPRGITVLDDYGHHPTEVKVTLEAVRPAAEGRLICVFQPHRYSRTKNTYYEFGESFDLADQLILMDIYPAGEKPLPGVDSGLILDAVRSRGHGPRSVERIGDHQQVVDRLLGLVRPGDTVVTIGAGDVYRVGDQLISSLRPVAPEQATVAEADPAGSGPRERPGPVPDGRDGRGRALRPAR